MIAGHQPQDMERGAAIHLDPRGADDHPVPPQRDQAGRRRPLIGPLDNRNQRHGRAERPKAHIQLRGRRRTADQPRHRPVQIDAWQGGAVGADGAPGVAQGAGDLVDGRTGRTDRIAAKAPLTCAAAVEVPVISA